jgi:hypothetical protein
MCVNTVLAELSRNKWYQAVSYNFKLFSDNLRNFNYFCTTSNQKDLRGLFQDEKRFGASQPVVSFRTIDFVR